MTNDLLRWTDRCVQCGLCLPHCPTYLATQNEAESPRGRIALIRALASEKLTADAAYSKHIDQCTGCLRCQAVCPASVNYADIIDFGKAQQRKKARYSWTSIKTSLIVKTLTGRTGITTAAILNRLAQGLKLPIAIPTDCSAFSRSYSKPLRTETHRSKAYLFAGCTGQYFDRTTWLSALSLLNKLRIEAISSPRQLCCGAIAQHSGDPQRADRLLTKTLASLPSSAYPLVTLATGCSAHFERHADAKNSKNKLRIIDIHHFLTEQSWPFNTSIQTYDTPIFLHIPCSAYQTSRGENDIQKILELIPGTHITRSSQSFGCCGAGGVNLMMQPQMGDKLVAPIVSEIKASQARIVVTANIGCQLQLRRALQKAQLNIPVIHPVTLLDHCTNYA